MKPNGYAKTSGGVLVPGGMVEGEQKDEKRREMKSAQSKRTRFGDVFFKLTVDVPKVMPEDDFKELMAEYGNILNEAFRKG